jgi:hypothetical protein
MFLSSGAPPTCAPSTYTTSALPDIVFVPDEKMRGRSCWTTEAGHHALNRLRAMP